MYYSKISISPLFSRISILSFSEEGRVSLSRSFDMKNMGSTFNYHLWSLKNIHELKARFFSSGSINAFVGNKNVKVDSMPLHLLSASRGDMGKTGRTKATDMKTKRSSWEEAAESFLAKKERPTMAGGNQDAKSAAEESGFQEEKEEDMEPLDDPRSDKIKDKYQGAMNKQHRYGEPRTPHGRNKESWGRNAYNKQEVRQWNKQENWGKKSWKEATEPSSVPKIVGQSVYGVGPILAAMAAERREFNALYVQQGLDLSGTNKKKKDKKAVEKILQIAERIGLKVVEASKHDLNMVVDNRPHQGLVLDASPLEMVSIKGLDPVTLSGERAPLWVALDEVMDPQNLGAIIRSAYFFGADGVVLCAKNSAPLSGVVSKASAGSLEMVELLSCKNMMQFLLLSAQNGWRVLGGSLSSKAVPLSEIEAGTPTILVLGSEGSGLRPLVERSCTRLIRIPGKTHFSNNEAKSEVDSAENDHKGHQYLKPFVAVESLNVSVSAGVLLYHLVGNNQQEKRR